MQRGQQVEVLEPSSLASMVLVRLFGQKEEGLVPLSSLKQPNGGFKYRNIKDDQGKPKHIHLTILKSEYYVCHQYSEFLKFTYAQIEEH